jgi:glycosyltransferase involved in cell wall biosynthesis
MRILLVTPAFSPRIGGLETIAGQLAAGFARHGHSVRVWTETPGPAVSQPFEVVRCPGPREALRLVRWCQVFLQANVGLRTLWPLLLIWRPLALSHHSWYCRSDGRVLWMDRLKRWLAARATVSIAVSDAMARDLGDRVQVVPNGYRDDLFRELPMARDREIVFLGRLVSDKGCDVLVEALTRLLPLGLRPSLTVIGDGPERIPLEAQVAAAGLAGQVSFAGELTGERLVLELNRHRILVVPSRYREPFGVVALEGLACGCVVIGSEGGGLPEAIGPCGVTFPNGDSGALAARLLDLMRSPLRIRDLRAEAVSHLARHRGEVMIDAYLGALAAVCKTA